MMGDGGPGAPVLQTEGNALLKAVFQGKLRLARLLLEGGAYINEGNERGETPVAAACLASYDDPATRQKMVRYLLEKGADPNIPDKTGRTALMHACATPAAAAMRDVVALLLENGADPSLKDYAGSSALVHAVNRGDRQTLQVLLDCCKARGQEVIIITSDTSPSGTKKTRQYLNAPPSPGLDQVCMSPSDVEIGTSSPPGDPDRDGGRDQDQDQERDQDQDRDQDRDRGRVFSFTAALPVPAARPPGERRPPPRKLLKRLNSEPWGLVASSVLVPPDRVGPPDQVGAPVLTGAPPDRVGAPPDWVGAPPDRVGAPLDRFVSDMNGLSIADPPRPPLSRRHSIETHDPGPPGPLDRSWSESCPPTSVLSWADKVQQHQILYRRNTAPEDPPAPGAAPAPGGSPDPGRVSVLERRRFNASPLSLLGPGSSRESLDSIPSSVSPVAARRRPLLERRGSGTLLLDHIAHTRPGFLPPLNVNPHRPIPDIRANGRPPSPPRILVPVAPASPKRGPEFFKVKKKLTRRHSMQPEQMKQLSTFQEVLEGGRD
ncbi:ankyrin repeat domain-containing protein 34A [Cololabis saira]|uniref:ankyrin repeat domain-containing protein 34A n=1 Tax=Cololabis saira TaxID=129043 RepID=UPI002AD2FD9D|nr:ankyrin repeat domain-containing protein 34A [Cololabis saira]